MTTRKPTSMDIAYMAGVSQATVSRAMRGSKLVSEETRERVMAVARELNYRIDRTAANLRSQRSKTLALLLFEDRTSDSSHINPFFLAMLGSITRSASARGYDLLVSFQKMNENWHTEYQMSNRADGIILLGYGDYTAYGDKLEALSEARANFVIWGPRLDDRSGHYLGSDNRLGARRAVTHLLELGRRRIAFIGSVSEGFPELALRYGGYGQALKKAGLKVEPDLQVDGDSREAVGRNGVRELCDRGVQFDAIFAASDLIAIGAIQELRNIGLDVPADVSVVGFDDIPAAAYMNPPLTTVRQDTARAGQSLVSNLIAFIEGEKPKAQLLPLDLVVRQSCGAGACDSPA